MGKRFFKILVFLLPIFLISCKGEDKTNQEDKKIVENNAKENLKKEASKENNESKEKTENKEESKDDLAKEDESGEKKDLKVVSGGKAGTMSNLVADREVWNDFIEEKDKKSAQQPVDGLHVPKILLDSADAKKANEDIDKIVQYIKEQYKTSLENREEDNEFLGIYSEFQAYEDDKILSLHMQITNTWDVGNTQHKIYNFSLADGKLINDDELLENFAIGKDDKLSLMEKSIDSRYQKLIDQYDSRLTETAYFDNIAKLEGLSLDDLWDDKELGDNRFFVDELGNIMFLYHFYTDACEDKFTEAIKLQGKDLNPSIYADEFVKMARTMGLDPNDEKIKAFIIPMGYAQAEDELEVVLKKLYQWQTVYNEYADPRLILQTTGDASIDLTGTDYYLIVPKWKMATVSLKELQTSEDGKTTEVENYLLDRVSQRSTTLICQNPSEAVPNSKITLRYRDEKIEFSPMISQKDGNLELPEGIIDADNILGWDNDQYGYSYTLFEQILHLMGRG